jgi:hypothetical protein
LNVGFLAKQVLGISRFQIEIEKNVQLGCYFDNYETLLLTSPNFESNYHYHQQLV